MAHLADLKARLPDYLFILAPYVGSFLSISIWGHDQVRFMEWYGRVAKPAGCPPDWAWGLIYLVAYVAIGIASSIVWHALPGGGGCLCSMAKWSVLMKSPLLWFWAHLLVEYTWYFWFFHAQNLGASFLVALGSTVLGMVAAHGFHTVNVLAGRIMMGYCAWTVYATYLGYRFYKDTPATKPKRK